MGSYDTSETISRTPRGSREETPNNYESRVPRPSEETEPTHAAEIDYEKPTLVSLGGGLTPARIVKKIDMSYIRKPAIDVVNYLISDEVATTKEEKNIADAVRERMGRSDYRAIINDHFNYHNDRLRTDLLKDYIVVKDRETEGGTLKYNFTDIAIVTHEEGGNKKMSDLEKKCSD